ncbi:hypothetical protein GCM10022247_64410 [Allokutzneria multivorans]|uniref:Uncharacterized protein n=1 Tax=Allokutzneria multivorans TaxID=1142134 RepID=A0ABP7TS47_9PSEU
MSILAKSAVVALALALVPVANAAAAPRVQDECNSYFCFRLVGDANSWTAIIIKTSSELTNIGIEGPRGQGGSSRGDILKVSGSGGGAVSGIGFQGFKQKGFISFTI